MLSTYVRNRCCKYAEELWIKHPFDLISVHMWTLENPNNVFYSQEHLGGLTPSYILHTGAFRTYLLGGYLILQKRL